MYKILVGCHCKNSIADKEAPGQINHPPLSLKPQLDKINISNTDISYMEIDNDCPKEDKQFKAWEDIATKSFDYVWLYGCPLWGALAHRSPTEAEKLKNIASTIIENSLRILKDGGQIIVVGYTNNVLRFIDKHALFMKKVILTETLGMKNVRLGFIFQKDLPFVLTTTRAEDNKPPDTPYMVFTKLPATAGRKKTRRSKRSKRRRTVSRV